jgi:hypothetical protein
MVKQLSCIVPGALRIPSNILAIEIPTSVEVIIGPPRTAQSVGVVLDGYWIIHSRYSRVKRVMKKWSIWVSAGNHW